jgi:hypothetical protein
VLLQPVLFELASLTRAAELLEEGPCNPFWSRGITTSYSCGRKKMRCISLALEWGALPPGYLQHLSGDMRQGGISVEQEASYTRPLDNEWPEALVSLSLLNGGLSLQDISNTSLVTVSGGDISGTGGIIHPSPQQRVARGALERCDSLMAFRTSCGHVKSLHCFALQTKLP